MAEQRDRWIFVAVFLLLMIAHMWLLGSMRLYPLVDLPNHLSVATILRHYDDPGNQFSDYFRPRLFPQPNVLYALLCSSPVFPSAEVANRFVILFCIAALPLVTLLIVRRVRGNPWSSLLAFLLLYHFSFCWGFMGYTLALPIILIVVYLSMGDLRSRGLRIVLAALFVVLFTCHAIAMLVAMLLIGTMRLVYHRLSILPAIREALVALPALGLLTAWYLSDENRHTGPSTPEFLRDYYLTEYLPTFGDRLALLPHDNLFALPGLPGTVASQVFFVALAVPFLITLWRRRRYVLPDASSSKEAGRPVIGGSPKGHWALSFFLVVFGCYILLPDRVPGNWALYQRLSVLVLLAMIPVCSRDGILWQRWRWRGVLIVVCLLHLVIWGRHFTTFDGNNTEFTADLFPEPRADEIVAGMLYDELNGIPVYMHSQCYQIIWNQGLSTGHFLDYRFGPIRRKVSREQLPPHEDLVTPATFERGHFDGTHFILAHSAHHITQAVRAGLFEPGDGAGPWDGTWPNEIGPFVRGRAHGNWALYERRGPAGRAEESSTTPGGRALRKAP